MSPRDNVAKPDEAEPDFGDDVYARAWTAMANLKNKDLSKVPFVTIESALGLVSTALGVLATYWPVLEAVRAAVDLTKTVIVTKESVRKRIAGLRLMQADMLCSLFSLRDFKREDVVIGNEILPGRLEMLCDHIRNDVKGLGNLMENYVTENWLGRILKDKGWKEAVTKCGEIVETRKKEILEVLALYNARRADQIAATVDHTLAPQLVNMAINIKALRDLFEPTPEEEEVRKEIKRLDGPEACLQSEEKLNELAKFIPSDEDSAKHKTKSQTDRKAGLSAAELRRIRTPVEQLLEKNLARFESKIDYLVDKARREHHTMRLIKKLAGARPYERIENPDIRKLWKEMGWGGSIDSHTFVLNLYDYFIDLERESRVSSRTPTLAPEPSTPLGPIPPLPMIRFDNPRAPSPTPSDAGTEEHDEFEGCTTPEAAAQDAWCLDYFNYRTLSTFMEVLDDDMNGLIKIKEVNEFTTAKPEGITLMQWIVYNAYGWLVAAHLYRIRLEHIIDQIAALNYAKENTATVSVYLSLLPWVTAFLRTLGEPDLDGQQLLRITHIVMEKQEQAVNGVLGMLNYELEEEDIRTMMELSVRGGPGTIGRIEERILPVLFLVVRRHYFILSLAKEYVLEENALERAAHTIDCITDLLINRTTHLRENFTKLQYDVDRKIQYVANGMFQDMHRLLSSEDETRMEFIDRWSLPWRSAQWISWVLQEYDPEFRLDPSVDYGPRPSVRDLVRVAVKLPDEPDEGYELVASLRMRYGVRLASSIAVEAVGEPTPPTSVDASPTDQPDPDPAAVDEHVMDTIQDDEGAVTPTEPTSHSGVQCDGCLTYPIIGYRFKCVDCDDFDYCSSCHGRDPPPLMHPAAIAGHHTFAHRFIRIERDIFTSEVNTLLNSLRLAPCDPAKQQLAQLDPLIIHCLSEPDDVVERVVAALVAYREHCFAPEVEDEEMGVGDLESLSAVVDRLASFPLAAEFATSRSHLLLRMRDGIVPIHPGYFCNGGDKCAADNERVRGGRYKCIDCPDFDFCEGCFDAHWHEHLDGQHRFVLLWYPTAHIVLHRLLVLIRSLPENPWKIVPRPTSVKQDLVTPEPEAAGQVETADMDEDGTAVDAPPTEAANTADAEEIGEATLPHCRGPCQRTMPEGRVYRCLSCELAPGWGDGDYLLCSDCAFATPQGNHHPTHVLAVIPNWPSTEPEAEIVKGANDALEDVQVSVVAVTNEDLSRRMDKIEETMTALLSMVGRLQELILTSAVVRAD
ncbi:hypothetical protein C8Q77DRAFT_369953 [Trametes polyzona]|nr:hypothetical protein C8Q77DRAFT_369953 [Trametes polyzona]